MKLATQRVASELKVLKGLMYVKSRLARGRGGLLVCPPTAPRVCVALKVCRSYEQACKYSPREQRQRDLITIPFRLFLSRDVCHRSQHVRPSDHLPCVNSAREVDSPSGARFGLYTTLGAYDFEGGACVKGGAA